MLRAATCALACALVAACGQTQERAASPSEQPAAAELAPLANLDPALATRSEIDVRCAALFALVSEDAKRAAPDSPAVRTYSAWAADVGNLATTRKVDETGISSDDALNWYLSRSGALAEAYRAWWRRTAEAGGDPHDPNGLYERDRRFCERKYTILEPKEYVPPFQSN